jgi:PadR family transcriptional regulator PadR
MTGPLERVLRALLEDPAARRYGYDLMKAAQLASGTLYPLLTRLEGEGLVTSHWETPEEGGEALRPRKYYLLTAGGERVARRELAVHYASQHRRPGIRPQPVPGTSR